MKVISIMVILNLKLIPGPILWQVTIPMLIWHQLLQEPTFQLRIGLVNANLKLITKPYVWPLKSRKRLRMLPILPFWTNYTVIWTNAFQSDLFWEILSTLMKTYQLGKLIDTLSWHYGLWSFQMGDTKLEIVLPKNQHTYSKEIV